MTRLRLIPAAIAAAAALLLVAPGCSSGSASDATPPAPTAADTARLLVAEVKNAGRLTLARMALTKMAVIDSSRPHGSNSLSRRLNSLLEGLKVGDRVAAYSFDTYVSAYIDLEQFSPGDIVLDSVARRVTLILPPIETRVDGRDFALREDHYRVTGLRSGITPEERARLKQQVSDLLAQELRDDPQLTDELRRKARAKITDYVTRLMAIYGYETEIRFRS